MKTSWVVSTFSAADLNGQTVEFQIPGQHSEIHGIGTFEARQLSGRRVFMRIRFHVVPDWAGKDGVLFRVSRDGCRQIEIHPDQSVARYRMFA
jgi:hypothetical protein